MLELHIYKILYNIQNLEIGLITETCSSVNLAIE